MPIYEYQCRACGTVTDVRHGFDEKNTEACAACGGELARRFSPTGIVFKGSGFYVTDSRKSQTTAGGSKSSKDATESAKADAPKGDAAKSDSPAKSDSAPSSTGSSGGSDSASAKGDTAAA